MAAVIIKQGEFEICEGTSDDGEQLICVTGSNFLPTGKQLQVQICVPRQLFEDFAEKLHGETTIDFIRNLENQSYSDGEEGGRADGYDEGWDAAVEEIQERKDAKEDAEGDDL